MLTVATFIGLGFLGFVAGLVVAKLVTRKNAALNLTEPCNCPPKVVDREGQV